MKVVALVGQKGGIGKTTIAMGLADVLAESQRVLLVDTDPQQSAAWWADQTETLAFDVVTERDPALVARLRDVPYDVVVVDTPGSLQDETMLAAVLDCADYAVVPAEPVALSLRPLIETIRRLIEPRGLGYTVLLNKVDSRSPADLTDIRNGLAGQGIPVCRTPVRLYRAHANAPRDGLTVTRYGTGGRARNAGDDLRRVATEVALGWAKTQRTDGVVG